MVKLLTYVILTSALLLGIPTAARAVDPDGILAKYPVPGSPYHLAVEGPTRVWVTLPAKNIIGRLEVTSPGSYDIRTFQLPTTASHPYDIVYAAGSIWVSEHDGNKIARFDPVAGTWTEYLIPTPASKPAGLAVLAGNPIQVWFCEQASSKLGLLTITTIGDYHFTEFPLPWPNAEPENIAATSSENVWFTAPGRSLIGQFVLSAWRPPEPGNPDPGNAFGLVSTNTPTYAGTRPYDIQLDGKNLPWFTEPSSNRIGHFNPATTTSFEWYPVRTPSSGLAGLDLALGYAWFTEHDSGRVGQLQKVGFGSNIREQLLPGANPAPADIVVGPDGCAWVSASGADALMSWCAPYSLQVYLPLIQRK